MSFSGSRKKSVERKIRAYEHDDAISQLKNERRQDKKAIGYKSKIALSDSNNEIIEARSYHSPDFAMTNEKIYLWTNFVLPTAKLLQKKNIG